MAIFYPPVDLDEPAAIDQAGDHAERRVLDALEGLDDKWRVFHRFQWRDLDAKTGERTGEADLVLFHPNLGILVIEVKGGGVRLEQGQWSYVSLFDGTVYPMKQSPVQQARRTQYYLLDRLKKTTLKDDILDRTAVTHAIWFPDIEWRAAVPPEIPAGVYLLDMRHLADPTPHLRKILKLSNPHARPWTPEHAIILIRTISPEVNCMPALGTVLGGIRERIVRMTQGQIETLRALRNQKRLLVEGCAGSGKTLLAMQLAHEHLNAGKRVLFTCFNKNLAAFVSREFGTRQGIDVVNFHELVRRLCEKVGIPYAVPQEEDKIREFFANECADLLMNTAGLLPYKYDTIIVDEAYDFKETWWIALEALGGKDFSYYAFYDRNQHVFCDRDAWVPPFSAEPIVLDVNVRNTKPVGDFALRLAGSKESMKYAVADGPKPEVIKYGTPGELPAILNRLITDLTRRSKVPAEEIVILSPYRYDSERLGIKDFVERSGDILTTNIIAPPKGKVRVSTIQSFKGLEADVVILCGIDGHLPACSPANLYVGATRARSILYYVPGPQRG